MSSVLSYYLSDLAYTLTNCLRCFPGSPHLRINTRSFKIIRLLGEGGFSYVYLVQDTSSAQLLALKKIRCPFGQESVNIALREVEAYALFSGHANIIGSVDHSIASDRGDASAKTVYILLPYYRRGNLQDIINANLVNHTKFPERRLMVLLLGVCRALKAMHQYRVGGGKGKKVRREGVEEEPLMEDDVTRSQEGMGKGDLRAYAHRDIKPGNIMIADDGKTPILMDLGSLAPSPTVVDSRSGAIAVQDEAAEHSTMPYRAPELFDVKTECTIDTKVDIWSLGCTVYACLVGKSPFEARSEETGGSLTMCVLGGDWRFPDEGAAGKGKANGTSSEISPSVKDVVRKCLRVEPSERPDVDELTRMVEDVIAELPAEEGDES